MGLATIDPHSQKEHAEDSQVWCNKVKINKEMYGIRMLCQTASGWPLPDFKP